MSLDNICYITVLVAVLGLISPALGIRCFQCNSFVNPECADIPVNDTHSPFLHKCEQRDDYQMFCRKVVQTVLDAPQFTRITRTCGWYLNKDNRTNCQVSDTDFKMETTFHCIRCFNCSSRTNMNCVTFEGDNASMIVECPQPNAFCRKTRQIITADSTTIITRACGWIKFEEHSGDYCMVTNTNFKQETSSGSTVVPVARTNDSVGRPCCGDAPDA
ncbi:hypothetical protein GEV33_001766 [Tenebrio molitor]|uniref:Uncharacterized protein n=1 Tax=Tenebrio molitor TaxID=7067 RepID=A0A8J6HUK5_TENMO|nr:hypothetical protein GEV33_001766 [Tenebrio molitor]